MSGISRGYSSGSSIPDIELRSDAEDDILDLGSEPPMSPRGGDMGFDLIVNKKKVSADVMSMKSYAPSESDESRRGATKEFRLRDSAKVRGDSMRDGLRSGYASPDSGSERGFPLAKKDNDSDTESRYSSRSFRSHGGDRSRGRDYDDDSRDGDRGRDRDVRSRLEDEMSEKREVLFQLERYEARGVQLSQRYTLQSDLEEMRAELHRIKRDREIQASVRTQRKIAVGLVSAIEFINNKFNPFDINLEGWSESFHENLDDLDDVFEELHNKYRGNGKKMMPPEMRLIASIAGSAVMTGLTNSMFKKSKTPGLEDVIRSNPALLRQVQQAAATHVMGNAAMNGLSQETPATPAQSGGGGLGGLLSGMMGGLFGGGNGGGGLASMLGGLASAAAPPPSSAPRPNAPGFVGTRPGPMPPKMQQPTAAQPKMSGPSDIESIINEIHSEISMPSTNANRFETMSVTDSEITDLLEEAPDLNGLLSGNSRRGRKAGGSNSNRRVVNI